MKKMTQLLVVAALVVPTLSFAQKKSKVVESQIVNTPAYSGGRNLEIASNQLIAAGMFGGGINSGLSIPTDASVAFGFAFDVAFRINSEWQISVPVTLVASSVTTFALTAGPQFNFGEYSRMNQFFAAFRPGILSAGGGSSFLLNAVIGKRFEIVPAVSYRPNFGITFRAAAGEASFDLSPLAISIEI